MGIFLQQKPTFTKLYGEDADMFLEFLEENYGISIQEDCIVINEENFRNPKEYHEYHKQKEKEEKQAEGREFNRLQKRAERMEDDKRNHRYSHQMDDDEEIDKYVRTNYPRASKALGDVARSAEDKERTGRKVTTNDVKLVNNAFRATMAMEKNEAKNARKKSNKSKTESTIFDNIDFI